MPEMISASVFARVFLQMGAEKVGKRVRGVSNRTGA
jgi:hypothetical protein